MNTMTKGNEAYLFPTSYAQKAIWFIEAVNQGSVAYTIPFAYRIAGDVNCKALADAINVIVAKHETLRTVFRLIDGEPKQLIFPEKRMEIPVEDFSGDEDALQQELVRLSSIAFDLAEGPLIRAQIFRLGEQETVLYMNFHHIIVDHLSIVQFSKELNDEYKKLLHGKATSPAAPLHYADYAVWQEEWQSAEKLDEKMGFWKDTIQDPDAFLPLPTDFPRPAIQEGNGEEFWFELPSELSKQIRAQARKHNLSVYIFMLSAYATLMHRYTGNETIVIGSPFANRSEKEELEQVMGCFINTLPLVFDLSGSPSFLDVMKRVRSVVMGAFNHQEVPFEKIVEEVKPMREPSYNPVFQVGFMLQDPPMEIELEGTKVKNMHLNSRSSKFDMLAWLWDNESQQTANAPTAADAGDSIAGLIEYNTDLFKEETLARFIKHYEALLGSIVEYPEQPIAMHSLVNEAQRKQLDEWNSTARDYPLEKGLHELFSEQAAKSGEKIAVYGEDESLSYAELEARSNQLARYLQQQGVNPGDYVGISLERSARMVVGLLGILKTGAAYVPLDPDYPKDRLDYMIEHSGINLVLTESELEEQLDQEQLKKVLIDNDWAQISALEKSSLDVEFNSELAAYVIYTSGSTGKPKGVMVPHRAVVNFLLGMAEKPGLNDKDVLLAVTTLSFDIAVLELYLPLVKGAQTVVVSREVATDGHALIEVMAERSVTMMQATPATWRLLMAADWEGNSSLVTLCGGEALPMDVAEFLLSKTAGLWNMYGPTETTVWSTCHRIEDPSKTDIVGAPIANTLCYVVDKNNQLLPPGIAGELLIGGDGVTHGYLNSEHLTSERFLPDQWRGEGMVYRTGDLVTWQEDGTVKYFNRIDGQIKIRGYRVEIGDIENQLLKCEEISSGAVVLQGSNSDQRLVAFYVLKEGEELSLMRLRKFMSEGLPKYMLPHQFVLLDEMPLTPSGKIDRKRLALYKVQGSGHKDDSFKPPQSESEKYYAKVWQDALNLEQIGLEDNFFDIGGHSLLSMQVVGRVKKEMGIQIELRAMVMSTLEQLAIRYPVPEMEAASDTQVESVETEAVTESVEADATDGEGENNKVRKFFKKVFKK